MTLPPPRCKVTALSMRLHYLQHVPFEHPGAILDWARANRVAVTATQLHAGETLPAPAHFDALVVMGGPMGVYDHAAHPWLAAEHALVRAAVDAGKAVLGICLGAQLLACALGAQVRRNEQREIGWFPIRETAACAASGWAGIFDGEIEVLHWHGDTFELPRGALHLASSAACAHQAFAMGARVLGLQFHLELRPVDLNALIRHCGAELAPGPFVQDADAMLTGDPARFERTRRILDRLLGRLFAAA